MNDEIKEILDNMFHIIMKYEEDFEDLEENEIRYQLSYNKMQKLYDYITNLQQKVDKYESPDDLTLFYMWLDEKAKDKMKQLQQENETMQKVVNSYDKLAHEQNETLEDYKSRCEKAIEYIKSIDEDILNSMFLDESYISNYGAIDLLNILQNGSDDNE